MSLGGESMKKIIFGLILILMVQGCADSGTDSSTETYPLEVPEQHEITFEEELGGYSIYFGNIHSHSAISDGEGSAQDAMEWAKFETDYDFYVITDHSEMILPDEWKEMQKQADLYNEDGVFTAMRGFEWSHPLLGHVCVYNTDKFTNFILTPFLCSFYSWLDEHDALAQFNHPGREILVFCDFEYSEEVSDNFFAMETGNKNDGCNDLEYLNYYPAVLDKGWRVAPTNNQDNHSLKTNSHRTVIVSEHLSRSGIMDAMKARRIYSSDDPDMKIIFKHDDSWMGSEIETSEETLDFKIWIKDNEPIKKVTLHTNKGTVAAELIPDPETLEVKWTPEVEIVDSTYFYIQVEEENLLDDDLEVQIAVTAPFWVTKK